ncbi:hypothetical protein CYMTET_50138 [Cymbomonas tetramitiformis]|uniref:Tubulin-tyrosine ligase family protein n=1 Tax=Cymbomonas tetramitiformis TaxID=36881 RepID=A0AAE0ETF5_9CHLO|nr:hypothetical protein CYMTET_50138 [Cymbomonas tetramitiformis]
MAGAKRAATDGRLDVFLHKTCLALPASEGYSEAQLGNRFAHATNHCVQRHHPSRAEGPGGSITLEELAEACYQQAGHTSAQALRDSLFQQIQELVAETFRAAAQNPLGFFPLANSFELYGFDFLVNEDCHLMLLEVNADPSMAIFEQRLQPACAAMLDDTVALVLRMPALSELRTAASSDSLPAACTPEGSGEGAADAEYGERGPVQSSWTDPGSALGGCIAAIWGDCVEASPCEAADPFAEEGNSAGERGQDACGVSQSGAAAKGRTVESTDASSQACIQLEAGTGYSNVLRLPGKRTAADERRVLSTLVHRLGGVTASMYAGAQGGAGGALEKRCAVSPGLVGADELEAVLLEMCGEWTVTRNPREPLLSAQWGEWGDIRWELVLDGTMVANHYYCRRGLLRPLELYFLLAKGLQDSSDDRRHPMPLTMKISSSAVLDAEHSDRLRAAAAAAQEAEDGEGLWTLEDGSRRTAARTCTFKEVMQTALNQPSEAPAQWIVQKTVSTGARAYLFVLAVGNLQVYLHKNITWVEANQQSTTASDCATSSDMTLLFEEMIKSVFQAVVASRTHFLPLSNCFELLCFHVALDKHRQPRLLQISPVVSNPSLVESDQAEDRRTPSSKVLHDLVSLAVTTALMDKPQIPKAAALESTIVINIRNE